MDLHSLLGDDAEELLSYECKGVPRDDLILPGPDAIDEVMSWSDRPIPVLRNLGTHLQPRALGGHRLPVDPAGRPGDRALRGGLLRPQPGLLRSQEPGRAGHRGRLQRLRHHPRACSGWSAGGTPTRSRSSPSSTTTSCSPIRAVRPDHVRLRPARPTSSGAVGGRGDHLLRIGAGHPPDPGGVRGVPGGARPRHVHGAVVLPAQQCLQQGRRRLLAGRRPDRAGQPSRRHHRGRHHQAEAGRKQRRLRRHRLRPDRPAGLRRADDRPTRST